MAITCKQYGKALYNALTKKIDLVNDTIKIMLCSSLYSPNQDSHDFKDDVTNEVTGDAYTAGGATLASKTLEYSADNNVLKFDAADPSWSNATITARYAVVYDDTPSGDGNKPLLCYIDFETDKSSNAGTFSIVLPSDGLMKITVS